MEISPTPTNPYSTSKEIMAFLESLQQHPQGPHGCSASISFEHTKQKSGWLKYFPDFENHFTYSDLFGRKSKDGSRNRIALFQRPLDNWVGETKNEAIWTYANWHAFAIAWIKKPDVNQGKDLVIFDIECRTLTEVNRLTVTSLPIVRGFITHCRKETPKRKINNIW